MDFCTVPLFLSYGLKTKGGWGGDIQVHANDGVLTGGHACICAKWRVFAYFVRFSVYFGESSRGNTIRGNRTESLLRGKSASERFSERISENLCKISENL